MSDELAIEINGFVADGVTVDGDGIVWTVEAIDGWFDSPPVRFVSQETQPAGEVVSYVRENARPLALRLTAHAPARTDPLGGLLCFRAIESIKPPFQCVNAETLFTVTDPNLTLHANVRRVGQIRSAILGESVAVQFQILLTAPDPYRYDADNNPFD